MYVNTCFAPFTLSLSSVFYPLLSPMQRHCRCPLRYFSLTSVKLCYRLSPQF